MKTRAAQRLVDNDRLDQPTIEALEQQLQLKRATVSNAQPDFKDFGLHLDSVNHNYHKLDLFHAESLVELLDNHPRRRLQCFTMGDSPEKPEEWRAVCIKEASGQDIFDALQRGRIWVNVTNVDHTDWRYRRVIEDMYAWIESVCPTVDKPELYYNTLTLAAPGTQFYYHISPENNMMWNLQGEATVSELPSMDFRFVSQEHLEEIFAREASGSIHYKQEFEKYVTRLKTREGDCVWWETNSPIRVQYSTFCVSLWTSFYCPMRAKRDTVQLANRYLLRSMGIKNRSITELGLSSLLKRLSYKIVNKLRPFKKKYDFTDDYVTNLRLNLTEDNCIEVVDELLIPEFSKFSQNARRT